MIDKAPYKLHLPEELYRQVEEILDNIKAIREEASGVLSQSRVPDAAAQLQDVLQSTEDATTAIIDAATAIQELSTQRSDEAEQEIAGHVTRIYEACNFQDLTGQRIKKVLANLDTLEQRLTRLACAVKPDAVPAAPAAGTLANGPQLQKDAPTQEEIDALFKSL